MLTLSDLSNQGGSAGWVMHHRIPKKILNKEIYGRKKQRQPRICWITDEEQDLRKMTFEVGK
jgi:hypothetical protein